MFKCRIVQCNGVIKDGKKKADKRYRALARLPSSGVLALKQTRDIGPWLGCLPPECSPSSSQLRQPQGMLGVLARPIKRHLNRQRSFKIMVMRMFSTLDKAKPDIESIRGLNLAAVTCTTVQVSKSAVVALATTCRA
jgi:hypothetical protein